MLWTLVVLAIGIFIGWNLPQPAWAQALQAKVVALWNEKFGNKE